jgi:hypothetical protein
MIPGSDTTMDASVAERPRAVTVIGWIWLILALLRAANGVLGLLVWRVGGLEKGIPFLPPRAAAPFRAFGLETVYRHGGAIFGLQILIASAVAFLAVSLLLLKPWARRAMVGLACIGILATLVIAAGVVAVTLEIAREAAAEAAQARLAGTGAAVAIVFVGSLAFGATIFVLRRPEVRRAFEPAPA